jgi:hypothetical protein
MVKIEFETDSAAFRDADNCIDTYEVSWILNTLKNRIIRGDLEGKIQDSNGDTIGKYSVE